MILQVEPVHGVNQINFVLSAQLFVVNAPDLIKEQIEWLILHQVSDCCPFRSEFRASANFVK